MLLGLLIQCLCLLSLVVAAEDAFQRSCSNFKDEISLPNVTVHFSTYIPANTDLSLPDNPPSCTRPSQLVVSDICRVAMTVATSDRSETTQELWLPREFSRRYLVTGNGGLSGCIRHHDLAYVTSLGFAAVGANNGHNGTTGEFFLNNPDVIEDFVWRSVYTSAVTGKQLTQQFYDKDPERSYYFGCSNGGRQGWSIIHSFPDLFDGVLVGAAANNNVNMMSWMSHFYPLTGPPSAPTFVTPEQWTAIAQLVLDQCDALDGAKDGILENPDLCNPDLKSLHCSSHDSPINNSLCLTDAQLQTAESIYQPFRGTLNQPLYPRLQPGVETQTSTTFLSGESDLSREWFQYVVHSDPSWDPATFTTKDAELALLQNPFNMQTWDSDLSAFQQAGGKVLAYHGLADPVVSSEISRWYYDKVSLTMNLDPAELDEFYRYFRISGLGHCEGGDGAGAIGQSLASLIGIEPERNVLMALVKWVEEGVAPEVVVGGNLGGDGEVEWERAHCRFPRGNRFVGEGEVTDMDSWRCV
ncbi:Tannase/feruloyl esterase [Aspergillus karnatakaensis]|uniref:Tannase/feruloyl esterase n=1 Tax=Aspergillus karnatakaensis TaxID=1810916 RepID=UPI003CCDEA82